MHKRFFSLSIILTVAIGICSSYAQLDNGLILHYPFNTDEGDIITDQSGKGNDGVVNGATFVNDATRGGVMQFDGNDVISIGDFNDAEGQHALSFGCWVQPTGEGLYGLIGKTRSNDDTFHLVTDCRTAMNIEASVAPEGIIDSRHVQIQNTMRRDIWQHLMAVYDGHQMTLYYNGSVVTQSFYYADSRSVRSNNVSAAVGDCSVGRGWSLRGRIDEVRVYNRALSAAEVQELANIGGDPAPCTPWVQKLGFSNTPDGPWDVTEFLNDETLYVRLVDVDVEADSASLRTRVHVTQPQRNRTRTASMQNKRTRTPDRTRAGSPIFTLEPQEDGSLMGSFDLSSLNTGYTYITVSVMDTDGLYVYQRRSVIYISEAAGGANPATTGLRLDTRTRLRR